MSVARAGKPGISWREGGSSAFPEGKVPRLCFIVHFGTAYSAREHVYFKVFPPRSLEVFQTAL